MSEKARTALINIGTRRRGQTISPIDQGAVAELQMLGLVGPKGGLTDDGSHLRRALLDAEMDALFN